LRGTDQVCLCFFGDGAANAGPFHESLNLAAIWSLPVVFLCENNGYALFTPQAQTTAITHIAERASAYGMPGTIVDGQDALAVYESVSHAVQRARAGNGPTLVEAKTYRYCEHAEFLVPLKMPPYRSEGEIASWRSRDPIRVFVERLQMTDDLTAAEFEAIRADVLAEVDASVEFAQNSPDPEPDALFSDVFVE
jgi:pyruvate dehydrogenase E1 component alpha subunit